MGMPEFVARMRACAFDSKPSIWRSLSARMAAAETEGTAFPPCTNPVVALLVW